MIFVFQIEMSYRISCLVLPLIMEGRSEQLSSEILMLYEDKYNTIQLQLTRNDNCNEYHFNWFLLQYFQQLGEFYCIASD